MQGHYLLPRSGSGSQKRFDLVLLGDHRTRRYYIFPFPGLASPVAISFGSMTRL
jgi:hypothetical protein